MMVCFLEITNRVLYDSRLYCRSRLNGNYRSWWFLSVIRCWNSMAWDFRKKYHGALAVLVLLHLFKRVSTEWLIAQKRRSVSTSDLFGAEHS
ncbi:hypothetical protein MRB53_001843 [Persea americana]|uniref:Uncharacterized protein n=1 Tax=Persea americana TaxID=3435 RepID=A0ACC2MSV9_PERAE|nr:hypothetical protein MRB53_001843 [Persea americana]